MSMHPITRRRLSLVRLRHVRGTGGAVEVEVGGKVVHVAANAEIASAIAALEAEIRELMKAEKRRARA